MTSADPNTEFDVELWAVKKGGDCNFLGDMDSLGSSLIITDGNGQGKGHFELTEATPRVSSSSSTPPAAPPTTR